MMTHNVNIWIIAETIENRVREISLEPVAAAMEISGGGGGCIRCLVPCGGISPSIDEYVRSCPFPVHILVHPDLRYHQPYIIARFIRESIERDGPSIFLMCDTILGSQTAAYAAAMCGAAFVPHAAGIRMRGGTAVFLSRDDRSRTLREMTPAVESAVVTTAAGKFTAGSVAWQGCGLEPVVVRAEGDYPWKPVSLTGSAGGSDLAEARVIIAAGRGVGSPEGLGPVRDLADAIPGSAVAGSRPVCDAGWLPYSSQVGMTGQTVRPDLYIACGISGSTQHLAGMMDSGCIVAVNTDPDAPFFSVADYCIVDDMKEFLPAFLEAYRSLAGRNDKSIT